MKIYTNLKEMFPGFSLRSYHKLELFTQLVSSYYLMMRLFSIFEGKGLEEEGKSECLFFS